MKNTQNQSLNEIINNKLNDGIIEKAIDEQFGKMIDSVVSDLFGRHGDITRKVKRKLEETMNPYIEQYDFSNHNIKVEHLLNELVNSLVGQQDTIIKNTKNLIGVAPIKEIKISKIFENYNDFVATDINTSNLDINYDDEPTYENVTTHIETISEDDYSSCKYKTIEFTCDEDEDLSIIMKIRAWDKSSYLGSEWKIKDIKRVKRESDKLNTAMYSNSDIEIGNLQLPIENLKSMNDFEIFLLKLKLDQTSIILDCLNATNDDLELVEKPEPEYY